LIPDLDIYRAAKRPVDQHGAEAVARATERAGALLADGDEEGAAIWRQITAAVEELQRERRPGEPVN
jgi:hypothetical protein